MSTKLELLKLSKKELIKKCKKAKVNTNGTKGDMIDRLLAKNTGKSKTKTKLKMSNKKTCLYLFKSLTSRPQLQYEPLQTTFDIKEVFDTFMEYLPIYTMTNFMIAFPTYKSYYNESSIIKEVIDNKQSNRIEYSADNLYILNDHIEISKQKPKSTSDPKILNMMVQKYSKTHDALKRKKFTFGGRYRNWELEADFYDDSEQDGTAEQYVQFNRTDIYNIDHLLTLFVGVRYAQSSDVNTKGIEEDKLPRDDIKHYADKVMTKVLDQLSWTEVMKYKEIEKDKGYKLMMIYFVYIFLDLILSFGGDNKLVIYSTVWRYVYESGDFEHDGWINKSGTWFMFQDNEQNVNCINFESIYKWNLMDTDLRNNDEEYRKKMEQEELERQRRYEEYKRNTIQDPEDEMRKPRRIRKLVHHHELLELLAPDFEQDEVEEEDTGMTRPVKEITLELQ